MSFSWDSINVIWGAPEWAAVAGAIVAVIVALVIWNYARRRPLGGLRWVALLLKVTAVVLLALCLLEPLRRGTRPRPQANLLPIVVDNSQSMQLKTSGGDESRGEQVIEQLRDGSGWRTRLEQDFDVRSYAFDARLQGIDSAESLAMDGHVSSLAGSLQSLAERFRGRPVGGALLMTDGNWTDPPVREIDWSDLGFPVYPVLPAGEDHVRDVRIGKLRVRQTDFESAPITVAASVETVGLDKTDVVVQLREMAGGDVVGEQTVSVSDGGVADEVSFRFRPKESGVRFYRLSAFREADRERVEDPTSGAQDAGEVEATLANNSRLVAIQRQRGPYRILYIAGRPNWEFKFLRRALQEDAEVQLVGLLRIAKEEPKFSFRDQAVSGSNPLYAGFGEAEEETAEQYDEPVIVRLGVKESEELSEGFPQSAEELFAYHGVILDDIGTDFFTQDQMLLLRRFVAARGGGLLMLGGEESFAGRRFGQSPLGELSPVYAPRAGQEAKAGAYRVALTREGMLQPWVRLRQSEAAETRRLEKMPSFTTLNPVGRVKPGASLLATAAGEANEDEPAIVAQRFGKGRTAAVPLGDLWRWSMRRDQAERDDPAQAWRQLTRWLVNEVPRRVEVRVQPGDDPSQPVTVRVTARDRAYLPLDNAKVELRVEPVEGEPFTLMAEPDAETAGVYQAKYWSSDAGGYRVQAQVTAADGSSVGSAEGGWAADPAASEFHQLTLNRSLLETIAEQSGGEVIRDDELEEFAEDLPNRKVPVTETWVYPIWHRPWVLLLGIVCLCGEWGLRRWKGLP